MEDTTANKLLINRYNNTGVIEPGYAGHTYLSEWELLSNAVSKDRYYDLRVNQYLTKWILIIGDEVAFSGYLREYNHKGELMSYVESIILDGLVIFDLYNFRINGYPWVCDDPLVKRAKFRVVK